MNKSCIFTKLNFLHFGGESLTTLTVCVCLKQITAGYGFFPVKKSAENQQPIPSAGRHLVLQETIMLVIDIRGFPQPWKWSTSSAAALRYEQLRKRRDLWLPD